MHPFRYLCALFLLCIPFCSDGSFDFTERLNTKNVNVYLSSDRTILDNHAMLLVSIVDEMNHRFFKDSLFFDINFESYDTSVIMQNGPFTAGKTRRIVASGQPVVLKGGEAHYETDQLHERTTLYLNTYSNEIDLYSWAKVLYYLGTHPVGDATHPAGIVSNANARPGIFLDKKKIQEILKAESPLIDKMFSKRFYCPIAFPHDDTVAVSYYYQHPNYFLYKKLPDRLRDSRNKWGDTVGKTLFAIPTPIRIDKLGRDDFFIYSTDSVYHFLFSTEKISKSFFLKTLLPGTMLVPDSATAHVIFFSARDHFSAYKMMYDKLMNRMFINFSSLSKRQRAGYWDILTRDLRVSRVERPSINVRENNHNNLRLIAYWMLVALTLLFFVPKIRRA